MIPFLESAGGNCQDTVILVELLAAAVRLLGASEGAVIETFQSKFSSQRNIHVDVFAFMLKLPVTCEGNYVHVCIG